MKFRLSRQPSSPQLEPKISIPEVWSDEHGIALRGWILTPDGPPDELELIVDGLAVPVVDWHARSKIVARHPEFRSGEKCGFWAYLPRNSARQVQVRARTGDQLFARQLSVGPKNDAPRADAARPALFKRFCATVNNERLSVLEIGARVVVPGSVSKRELFPAASSYCGFDLYADENTDLVGDVHRLSSYFQEPFDAVFSLAVLEHLAMPWAAALEINKVLRPGGITFHQTHFAFPLHEQPADYWRFTEEGLRAIFSPVAGFGDVECEFSDPVSLHPTSRSIDHIHLPSQPAFIQVAALARKVGEVDAERIRWEVEPSDVAVAAVVYPRPNAGDARTE